jgi:uncharacterized protein (DUF1684 family)
MKILHLYRMSAVFLFIAIEILGAACSKGEKLKEERPLSNDPVLSERIARDEVFRSGEGSPIPMEDRDSFQGLEYFPVNKDLRFSVQLNRHSRPIQVRLGTNTGEIRSGLRYGYFDFIVEGQSCRLQVYRLDDVAENGGPNLFIPFRDATSGKETYAIGRYIDLAENTSGIYGLDLNRAYNPYCAFNNSYSCPLPPEENILTVPIRAGEKKYRGKDNAD